MEASEVLAPAPEQPQEEAGPVDHFSVEPSEPAPEIEAPAADAAPDANDPWAALNQRLDGIEEKLTPEQEAEQSGDGYSDLLDQLLPEYEEENEPGQQQAPEQPAPDDDAAALEDYIGQRVEQALQPHLMQQEWDRRRTQLNDFADKNPEVREKIGEIHQRLQPLSQRYGDGVFTDPGLVRDAYFAMKAEAVAAAQTPAEAVGRGANLETNAGPSGGQDQESPQAQITKALLGETDTEGVPFL